MYVDVRSETGYVRAAKLVTREKQEVVMPTVESIQVLVDGLRTRQDELKKDVRELRADDRSIHERLDAMYLMLSKRIDAVEARCKR